MCNFFSFVTDPERRAGKRFYYSWPQRQEEEDDDRHDSHTAICTKYGLDEDTCNKYEYNPLTGYFNVDDANSPVNDSVQAEEWVRQMDFKQVVEPLIIKKIVNPFLDMPKVDVAEERHMVLLKEWASVRDSVGASVRDSVRDSVWASVRDSVWDSVWASVWDSVWASVRDSVVGASVWASVRDSVRDSVWASVRDSVWDSVWASVWAYISSFFNIQYAHDFSCAVKLWEEGIVPSFDGTTWRLHSGKSADVIYEISAEELRKL